MKESKQNDFSQIEDLDDIAIDSTSARLIIDKKKLPKRYLKSPEFQSLFKKHLLEGLQEYKTSSISHGVVDYIKYHWFNTLFLELFGSRNIWTSRIYMGGFLIIGVLILKLLKMDFIQGLIIMGVIYILLMLFNLFFIQLQRWKAESHGLVLGGVIFKNKKLINWGTIKNVEITLSKDRDYFKLKLIIDEHLYNIYDRRLKRLLAIYYAIIHRRPDLEVDYFK